MDIFYNGKRSSVSTGITLAEFAKENKILRTKGIAIVINDEVISAKAWEQTIIRENDHISLFGAIQGG